MKILLIHPPVGPTVIGAGILFLGEPLALETIAAPIQDHHVEILDMRIDKKWDDLRAVLEKLRPDVAGVTALTTEAKQAIKVLEIVKEYSSDILTVVGGQHVTFAPQDFNLDSADVSVIGEGVQAFREIIDTHEAGKDMGTVAGLALRRDGIQVFTPQRAHVENLDEMPIPARHLTKKYRNSYFRGTWRPYACMVTSRGCPFRCKFCSVWKSENGKYRVRSPRKVIQELETIKEDKVGISDDNFLHDVHRAETIYELIKAEGIEKKYKLIGRSDTIVRRPDIAEKWREIGTEIVVVGVESFRNEDLKDFNKRTTVEKNNQAIRILQDNGIAVSAHFVIHQDYTAADFEALAEYVHEMNLRQPVFCILTPLPGTDLYEETKHRLLSTNYEMYDFSHTVLPTKLPLEEFYRQFVGLYKKCYLREGPSSPDTFISDEILQAIFDRFSNMDKGESAPETEMLPADSTSRRL